MARWLFVMYGGITPGGAIGPVRDDDHQEELILQELRTDAELLADMGEDTIHKVEIGEDGVPVLSSFSGGYMDELRGLIDFERGNGNE